MVFNSEFETVGFEDLVLAAYLESLQISNVELLCKDS